MRESSQSGFTIIELIVVMTILVVLAVVAVPSVMQTLRARETQQGSEDFMNLAETASLQSSMRGVSYALQVQVRDSSANGSVRVLEGKDSSCGLDNFIDSSSQQPYLTFRSYDYSDELPNVGIESITPATLTQDDDDGLCFKPDGRMFRISTEAPVAAASASGYGAGEVVVVIQRRNDAGTLEGVAHRVLVPYNGIPRYTFGSSTEGASE